MGCGKEEGTGFHRTGQVEGHDCDWCPRRRDHKTKKKVATMMTVTLSQVKRMSEQERLRHYEQEKDELFFQMKSMTAEEVRDAHEALRKKWMV